MISTTFLVGAFSFASLAKIFFGTPPDHDVTQYQNTCANIAASISAASQVFYPGA
jgi:hypothetical protein